MPTFNRIEDIDAWKLARELHHEILSICDQTPLGREFKFKTQITSASGSVMDNIAEGFGRGGNKEFIHFLEVAHASCTETQSQLYRVLDCGYIDEKHFVRTLRLSKRTAGAIRGLIRYLQQCEIRGPRFQ